MKDIYVKEEKIGGRTNLKKREGVRPFIVIALLFAVGAALVFLAPHILRWPVTITLNGTQIQVAYDTTLRQAAQRQLNRDQLFGDLLAVDGSVLREGGGEGPTFMLRGEEVSPDIPIRSSMVLAVHRGAHITEAIVEEETEIEPELHRRGRGSLYHVVDSGQVGRSLRSFGQQSDIELSTELLVEPRAVVVQASAFREESPQLIALTFDDGPHPVHTPAVLEVLAAEGVQATFFVAGIEVSRFPEVAYQIVAEGHQIANHGYDHRDYRSLTYAEQRTDFQRAQDAIEEAAGVRPSWVRPPYGQMNASTFSLFGKEDIRVAHWTIDPLDFRRPGVRVIRERVVEETRSGSVILLHDGGGDREQTVRATRGIIRDLHEEGFEFVTVEQLFEEANR